MNGVAPRELHRELQDCQRRLGTAEEREGDFDRVLALAHQINNQLTVELLHHIDPTADDPRSLVAVFRNWLNRKERPTEAEPPAQTSGR